MMNVFNKIYLNGISSINHILDRMYSVLIEFGSDEFKMELKKIGVEHVEDLYRFNPSTHEIIDTCLHEFTQWSPIESLKYLELQFKSGEFSDNDIDTFISKNHLDVIKSGFIEEDCPDSIKNFLIGESYGGMLRSEIRGIDIDRLESIPINLWLEVVNEYSSSNNLKGSTNDFIESVQFINTLSYSWDQLKNVNSRELNQHDMKIRVNNNLTDQQLAEIYSGNYQLIPKLNQTTTTGSTKPSQLVTDIDSFNQLNSNQKKRVNQFLTTHYNKFIQSISNHVNNVFSVVSSVDLNKFTKEYNKVCKNSIYSSDDKIKSMYKSIEKCFKNYDIKTVSVGMDSLVHGYIPLLHSFKSDSELSNVVYNPVLTVIAVSSRLTQPKRSYLTNSRSESIDHSLQPIQFSTPQVVQLISGGDNKETEKNKIESIATHINDLQIEFNHKYSIEYNNIIKKLNQLDLNSIKFDLNDVSSNSYPYVVGMIDNVLVDEPETTNSLSGLYINKDNSEMFIKYCQDCSSKCGLCKPFDCIVENLNNIVKLVESTRSEFKSIKDVNVLSSDNYDRISSYSHNNYIKQEDIIRKKEVIQQLQSHLRSQYKNMLTSTSTKSILDRYNSTVEKRTRTIQEYFDNYIKSTVTEFRKLVSDFKKFESNDNEQIRIVTDRGHVAKQLRLKLPQIESDMKLKLKLINQRKLNYIWLNEEFDKFLVQCRSSKLHSEVTETGLLRIHDVISKMGRLDFVSNNDSTFVCSSTQDYYKTFNQIKKYLMESPEISTLEHYFYSLRIVNEKFNFSNLLLKLVEFIIGELLWFQVYKDGEPYQPRTRPEKIKLVPDQSKTNNVLFTRTLFELVSFTYDFHFDIDEKNQISEYDLDTLTNSDYSIGFGFTTSPMTIFNDFYLDVINSLYVPVIQVLDNYGSRIEQQGNGKQLVKNNIDLMLQGGNLFDDIYKNDFDRSSSNQIKDSTLDSTDEYTGGSLFDNIPSNRIENNINVENVPVYISSYKLLEYYGEHYCNPSNKLRIVPNRSSYISELIGDDDRINLNDFNKFIRVINAYCSMTTETNREKRLRTIIETIINELNSMLIFGDEFSNDGFSSMNLMSISTEHISDFINSMSQSIPETVINASTSVSNVNQVVNEIFENAIKSIEHCNPSTRLATLKSIIVNDTISSGERNEMYVSFHDSIKSIFNILDLTLKDIISNDNLCLNLLDVVNNLTPNDSRTISEKLGHDYIEILKNSSYLYPNVNSTKLKEYINKLIESHVDLKQRDETMRSNIDILYPIDNKSTQTTYLYINPKNLEPAAQQKRIVFDLKNNSLNYNNTDLVLALLLNVIGNDHLPFKFYQLLSDSQLNGNTFREDPNETGFTSQVLYYESLYYSTGNQVENQLSKRTINKLISFIPFLIKVLTIFSNCQCQSNDKSIFKYVSYRSSTDQNISPTVESEILINILREFYESLVLKSDKLMFMCGNLSNADFDNMNKLLVNNGLMKSFIKHPENFEWIYSFTCGDLGLPIPNHDRFSTYFNRHKTLLDPRFNNSFVTNVSNLATLLMNGLLSYFMTTPKRSIIRIFDNSIYQSPTPESNQSTNQSTTPESNQSTTPQSSSTQPEVKKTTEETKPSVIELPYTPLNQPTTPQSSSNKPEVEKPDEVLEEDDIDPPVQNIGALNNLLNDDDDDDDDDEDDLNEFFKAQVGHGQQMENKIDMTPQQFAVVYNLIKMVVDHRDEFEKELQFKETKKLIDNLNEQIKLRKTFRELNQLNQTYQLPEFDLQLLTNILNSHQLVVPNELQYLIQPRQQQMSTRQLTPQLTPQLTLPKTNDKLNQYNIDTFIDFVSDNLFRYEPNVDYDFKPKIDGIVNLVDVIKKTTKCNYLKFSSLTGEVKVKVYRSKSIQIFKNHFIETLKFEYGRQFKRDLTQSKSIVKNNRWISDLIDYDNINLSQLGIGEHLRKHSTIFTPELIARIIIEYLEESDNIFYGIINVYDMFYLSYSVEDNELDFIFDTFFEQLNLKHSERTDSILDDVKIWINWMCNGDNTKKNYNNEFGQRIPGISSVESKISKCATGISNLRDYSKWLKEFKNRIDDPKFHMIMFDETNSIPDGTILKIKNPFDKESLRRYYNCLEDKSKNEFVLCNVYKKWIETFTETFTENENVIESGNIDIESIDFTKPCVELSPDVNQLKFKLPKINCISSLQNVVEIYLRGSNETNEINLNLKQALESILLNGWLTDIDGTETLIIDSVVTLLGGDLINNFNDLKTDMNQIVQVFNTQTVDNKQLIVGYFNKLVLSFNSTFSKNIFAEIMYNSAILKKKLLNTEYKSFKFNNGDEIHKYVLNKMNDNNYLITKLIKTYSLESENSFRKYKLGLK